MIAHAVRHGQSLWKRWCRWNHEMPLNNPKKGELDMDASGRICLVCLWSSPLMAILQRLPVSWIPAWSLICRLSTLTMTILLFPDLRLQSVRIKTLHIFILIFTSLNECLQKVRWCLLLAYHFNFIFLRTYAAFLFICKTREIQWQGHETPWKSTVFWLL